MPNNKKNDIDVQVVLNELKNNISINDGKLAFTGFWGIDINEWLLLSAIDFKKIESLEIKKQILNKAIWEIANKNDFSKDYFLDTINREIDNQLKRRTIEYHILTSLSGKNIPFRKVNLNKCVISLHGNKFPRKYRTTRNDLLSKIGKEQSHDNYTKVTVKVKSSNHHEAFQKAEESLDIFRGLINLSINNIFKITSNEYSPEPINKIINGEIYSIHFENGEIVSPDLWYFEEDHPGIKSYSFLNDDKRAFVRKAVRKRIKALGNCKAKHKKGVEEALINYVNAFDEKNKNYSFLKSWTALELLMQANKNTDKIISRATSIFYKSEKSYVENTLKSLRYYRNSSVHESKITGHPRVPCYLMHRFLKSSIEFHLEMAGKFNSISEAVEFLDLRSLNIKDLESKKNLIDIIMNQSKIKIT